MKIKELQDKGVEIHVLELQVSIKTPYATSLRMGTLEDMRKLYKIHTGHGYPCKLYKAEFTEIDVGDSNDE